MKFKLTIAMDNAAFEDGADGMFEVARILEELAADLRNGSAASTLMDVNGNSVGRYTVTK
ncbi:MAG TPA: hypothetical protein VNU68_02045 [Verrucomicrobiae bacterium]|nr:hypothetical protein [Verrucomicrobiae bacterium]